MTSYLRVVVATVEYRQRTQRNRDGEGRFLKKQELRCWIMAVFPLELSQSPWITVASGDLTEAGLLMIRQNQSW